MSKKKKFFSYLSKIKKILHSINEKIFLQFYFLEVYRMNKSELSSKISEKSGLTKVAAEKALNAFTEAITEALVNGEKVQLVGFGTFEPSIRNARFGFNPATGEKIQIAETKTIHFKSGKALKDSINQ